ncbi:Kdo hydroxylase family protein, partial [Escherichia coli]|uniref:Kdo hydroxylase family protein n=4 Tax=Pseudomonadota TaxID=1224 RepID=UPI0039E1D5D8
EWQVEYPNQDWITALEAGKVLYFPQLAFQLMDSERKLLDPAVRAPKSRNISLDARGHIKGAAGGTEQQLALAAMIGRFREQSLSLVH